MKIYNQTRFIHAFTEAIDKTGQSHFLLVVKGSFDFPDKPGQEPQPSLRQRPLVMADEYTGKPGLSAVQWESDFAFRKARCDVVAQGAAYAPEGRPMKTVRVGVRVGAWAKVLDVIGAREWRMVGPVVTATEPHPFTKAHFSYDTAFGGRDASDPDESAPPVYRPNPVGLGWQESRRRLSGQPLPNTQAIDQPVTSPFGSYRAMALGPVGRGWPERVHHGGTYDQDWQDSVFPFLPDDFDDRYYQCAPEDQQIEYPAPGTPVVLANLTPRGRENFHLPRETDLTIRVFRGRETALEQTARPDTLLFDCEARVLMMVYRVWLPVRRAITEFTEAWVGPPTPAMLRARESGKRYVRMAGERAGA